LAEVGAFAQQNQRADCSESKTGPWCSYPLKLEMPRKAIDPVAIYVALGVPAGPLRIDGRRIIPAYLFEVKKPEESKYP
jgi:hypothetical protein